MRNILLALAFLLGALPAEAASRFWVGGTGTWDASDTTHWAATTGGAGGQSVPGSGDAVTLDGSSGGGTVTVNTTVTVQSITCGAFTGTLDFSANNNNVTLSATSGFNCSGAGTRTLNLGNGTWTLTAASGTLWTMTTTTGLTFSANSSSIVFSGTATSAIVFQGGALTYNSVAFNVGKVGASINGANTFATLTATAPASLFFGAGVTNTITNAFSFTGTSASPIFLSSSTAAVATVSTATGTPTMTWGGVRGLTFTGGATFSATNAIDLGLNTGITITAPTTGGGRIIGG